MWELYSEKVGSDETKLVDSVTAVSSMWELYSEKVGSDETKLVDSVTALRNVSQLNCKYM